ATLPPKPPHRTLLAFAILPRPDFLTPSPPAKKATARSLCFVLSVPRLLWTCFQLAATLTAPLLQALRSRCRRVNSLFEDPGSALKGGVNFCQRQLVNEVLGLLLTEFFPDPTHKGATSIQRRL